MAKRKTHYTISEVVKMLGVTRQMFHAYRKDPRYKHMIPERMDGFEKKAIDKFVKFKLKK